MNQSKLIAAVGAVVCGTLGVVRPASADFFDPSTGRATASFTYSITLTDLAPDDGFDPFFEMAYSVSGQ